MSQINVLGISGSPRQGNSSFLLTKALAAAQAVAPEQVEIKEYSLRAKKVGPCLSCFRCSQLDGECCLKDDFQELRDLWLAADVVLYSVPVYHMGIPGQLKCFIDRLGNSMFAIYQGLFNPGEEKLPRLLKVIGGIAQGAHIFSGQEHALTQIINHAMLMQSIPVTGDMWQSYIGAGGWTSNDIDRKALSKQAEAKQTAALLAVKAAEDVGKRAVETALILRSGALAHKQELSKDPTYKPLLDRLG